MHREDDENDNKTLHDPEPKQASAHERDNEFYEPDSENELFYEIDEPDADHVEEDDDSDYEPAVRRKWIKNTVIVLLVAALIGNILAFWPQIYNMETLPFLFKSRELSSREEIQSYKEAVVVVGTDKGKGTGFHISQGFIVTNYHVIDDAAYSIVQFPENSGRFVAEVVGFDADLDVAILEVDSKGQELPFIEIEEHGWEPGAHIYVIGNPLYFTQIVNEGKVLGTVPIQGRPKPAMAVDAPVFKGNSGSPVINEHGNAIAVIYATGEIMHQGKMIDRAGLAVPLSDLDTLLQGLLPEKKKDQSAGSNPRKTR